MKRKLDWLLKSNRADILLEDKELVVIDKPSGLLVLPDRYNRSLPNLYEILRKELGKVYVVHRIDKETSGVIAFAKSDESHRKLNQQFESRAVEKIYVAICEGNTTSNEGEINLPLAESANGIMLVNKKKGKEAVTNYTIVEHFQGYALVGAIPRTGRTHQIRVHLREIRLPILGDPLYGNGEPFFLSGVKANYKKEGEEKPLLNRTALHAAKLTFEHPASGEWLTCEAPLPKDMKTVLKYLRKFRAPVEA
ncbi:MAG: RluA family pseudouridine synthase [Ignavibacteriales bacterium]|nr:RluA family pseudouridine synthase [Ignavibacteriales bacterium]